MRYGQVYSKKEEAAYAAEVRARQERQLVRRGKELGYQLVPIIPPDPEAEIPAASTA